MMLGFDTDKPDIFERQIKLVEEAKIVHSSVGMVTAIPKTPLYARMLTANRLDLADPHAVRYQYHSSFHATRRVARRLY
jgi:hypothetical protein